MKRFLFILKPLKKFLTKCFLAYLNFNLNMLSMTLSYTESNEQQQRGNDYYWFLKMIPTIPSPLMSCNKSSHDKLEIILLPRSDDVANQCSCNCRAPGWCTLREWWRILGYAVLLYSITRPLLMAPYFYFYFFIFIYFLALLLPSSLPAGN